MLVRPLYELLPYVLLIAGGTLLLMFDAATAPLALILYGFGAWVWMQRSEPLCAESRGSSLSSFKIHWTPFVYELLPFIYALLGLLIINYVTHPVRYLTGPLLILTGVVVLAVRDYKRRQGIPVTATEPLRFRPEPERMAGARVPIVTTSPGAPLCERCVVLEVCQAIKLEDQSIREIMRLSQTVSHEHAYDLFRQAVERIEGRRVSEQELRPILDQLSSHANLCATWRRRGRHAS